LGSEANDLIWGKYISSTEVIRRAQELVDKCNRHLPKSADTSKKWVQETFGSMDDLFKNVMALHVAIFTCSWRATSGVENVFNVFKKYKKGNLKRSLLYDAVMELLEMVQRRLQNDCVLVQSPLSPAAVLVQSPLPPAAVFVQSPLSPAAVLVQSPY
jgi:hypothetical protein